MELLAVLLCKRACRTEECPGLLSSWTLLELEEVAVPRFAGSADGLSAETEHEFDLLVAEPGVDFGTRMDCRWLQCLETAIVGLKMTTGLSPVLPTGLGLPMSPGFEVGQDTEADQVAELVLP